jgi:hypothetical protein
MPSWSRRLALLKLESEFDRTYTLQTDNATLKRQHGKMIAETAIANGFIISFTVLQTPQVRPKLKSGILIPKVRFEKYIRSLNILAPLFVRARSWKS